MAARTVTLTDTITGKSATCATYDVADTIKPWFKGAPADVRSAITALQEELTRGAYPASADYLALQVG